MKKLAEPCLMSASLSAVLAVYIGSSSSCGAVTCCQACQSQASLQVLPPSNDKELIALRSETERLQTELGIARARLQNCEQQLKDR